LVSPIFYSQANLTLWLPAASKAFSTLTGTLFFIVYEQHIGVFAGQIGL
jgi:hypothetical protein